MPRRGVDGKTRHTLRVVSRGVTCTCVEAPLPPVELFVLHDFGRKLLALCFGVVCDEVLKGSLAGLDRMAKGAHIVAGRSGDHNLHVRLPRPP